MRRPRQVKVASDWSMHLILTSHWSATSSQRLGRKYGLQPKFVKMRELHLLMFYLIYGYSGEADLDQAETIQQLRGEGLVDDKVILAFHWSIQYSQCSPLIGHFTRWRRS